MPSIACILVPDFPLAALIRANPELRDKLVASSDGRGPHAELRFVAPLARRAGVTAGMTAAQGAAIAPDLVVVSRSPASERSAMDALIEVAESFSPIVEDGGPGCVYLDLGDLTSLQREHSVEETVSMGKLDQRERSGNKAAACFAPPAWNAVECHHHSP